MSLTKYKQKRDFKVTSEPDEKSKPAKGQKLIFVIQEHHATRLHYDFRLELQGVLKSWAVPKGPTMDPSIKRLAMMVEDHPYEYHTFHGRIPEGQYGAGTVKIWDKGTYTFDSSYMDPKPAEINDEKELLKGLKRGDLKFVLKGKKLKGQFALVKTHSPFMKGNSWLLLKKKDKYAKAEK